VSGLWEEVYSPTEHDPVPAEKPFGTDRKNLVAIGVRRGRLRFGGSVWGERDHHSHLALSERDAAVALQLWKKMHERFLAELELVHVQLDELWANVKNNGQEMWLWIASDVKAKIIPVMQVGARNQEMAYSVVHELKGRLAAGCVPVFSTDGLKHYFYALTAHFGKW
jgi:hypothetical protein